MPIIKQCICGKEFQTKPSKIKDGRGKFCSRKCHYKNAIRPSGLQYKIVTENRSWFKRGFTSWNKGKSFSDETIKKMSARKRGLHLSIKTEFKSEDMLGEKNPNWKGGKPNCVLCFKKLSSMNPASGKCMECKKKNPIKRDERNDSNYQSWVRKVKSRDGWKCKMENEHCFGYYLVHHILPWRDYPEERYNINNGITLCQAHHPRKRVDEQKLIPFFQSLVEVG